VGKNGSSAAYQAAHNNPVGPVNAVNPDIEIIVYGITSGAYQNCGQNKQKEMERREGQIQAIVAENRLYDAIPEQVLRQG